MTMDVGLEEPSNGSMALSRYLSLAAPLVAIATYMAAGCSTSDSPSNPDGGTDGGGADAWVDGAVDAGYGRDAADILTDAEGGDGASNSLCPASAISADLLEAAHDALADGGTDAKLSADGCIHLHRSSAGAASIDEVLYGAQVTSRWTTNGDTTTGERDEDFDGTFEWNAKITRTAGARGAVITRARPDGTLLSRDTYTVTDSEDSVHALLEIDDGTGTGTLTTDVEFDAPVEQPATITGPTPGTGAGDCTPEQAAQIQADMQKALSDGAACAGRGVPGLAQHLGTTIPAQGIELRCGSRPGECAAINWWSAVGTLLGVGSGPIVIVVDPDNYFGAAGCQNHAQVLLHELLHTLLGLHSGYDPPDTPQGVVHDRVYACASLCEDTAPTKCQCASCLRTTVCDPRCAGYADCNPDLGAQCRCFSNPRYYSTYTECTVKCPTGLACFAASCKAVDYSCH
jgi:hypothetical protein